MTIHILERAPLQSLQGYIARQRVHLDQLDELYQYLSAVNDENIALVIRAGPVDLGTCTFHPWHLHMRPPLQGLTTEVLFESIGLLLSTTAQSHSTPRSPTIGKQ